MIINENLNVWLTKIMLVKRAYVIDRDYYIIFIQSFFFNRPILIY